MNPPAPVENLKPPLKAAISRWRSAPTMFGPKRQPLDPASVAPECSRSSTKRWSNESSATPDADRAIHAAV